MKKKHFILASTWLTAVLVLAGVIFSLQNSGLIPRFFPENVSAQTAPCTVSGDFIIQNSNNVNVSGTIHGSLGCYSTETVSFGCIGSGIKSCSAGYYLAGVEFCDGCPAEGKICGLRCCKSAP